MPDIHINIRHLTFENDVLTVFAGIMLFYSDLNSASSPGFLYGIPLHVFSSGLLRQQNSQLARLTRRNSQDANPLGNQPQAGLGLAGMGK